VNLGRLDAADYGELTRQLLAVADRLCCGRVVSVLEGGYGTIFFEGKKTLLCLKTGVDCGPSGEYVPTVRREAFDSCLREHLTALVECGHAPAVNDQASRTKRRPQEDDHYAKTFQESLQRRDAMVDTFFQRPPVDSEDNKQQLTANNLAHLGENLGTQDKIATFLNKRRRKDNTNNDSDRASSNAG